MNCGSRSPSCTCLPGSAEANLPRPARQARLRPAARPQRPQAPLATPRGCARAAGSRRCTGGAAAPGPRRAPRSARPPPGRRCRSPWRAPARLRRPGSSVSCLASRKSERSSVQGSVHARAPLQVLHKHACSTAANLLRTEPHNSSVGQRANAPTTSVAADTGARRTQVAARVRWCARLPGRRPARPRPARRAGWPLLAGGCRQGWRPLAGARARPGAPRAARPRPRLAAPRGR